MLLLIAAAIVHKTLMLLFDANMLCCYSYQTPHVPTAVAYALREHQLQQAAASTFAAARLKLEAKLFKDLPPPPTQPQQQQQQGDASQAFPLPVLLSLSRLPSSHRSVRGGGGGSSSRLPLLLDFPRDAGHHVQKLNPFTAQASCSSSVHNTSGSS